MRLRIVLDRAKGRFWERPMGRWEYVFSAVWCFYAWTAAAAPDSRVLHKTELVLAVAWTVIFPLTVNCRMVDLGVSRRWALPYTLLLLGIGSAFFAPSRTAKLIAIVAYLAVQAPLVFLPSRRAPASHS